MRNFSLHHRFFYILTAALGAFAFSASAQTVSFTVSTSLPGARFAVDGTEYYSAATFQWPAGSKHLVSFLKDPLPPVAFVPGVNQPILSAIQLAGDKASLYVFTGWVDNTGLLLPGADPNQIVTASGSVTSLTGQVTLSYRIILNLMNNAPVASPTCDGSPGAAPGDLRVGLVYIGGLCYWNSAVLYLSAGSSLTLNAFPFPGFVFLGWSFSTGPSNSYLQSFVLNGPLTLVPTFTPGKRVRFLTDPLGLNVLVDRTAVPTLPATTGVGCPHSESLPLGTPPTITPLCYGDFDFAPGSNHLVGAPSPQTDLSGHLWVFNSWTSKIGQSGQIENSIYATDQSTANPDVVTVKFDPGARASFLTNPPGLPLNVDGRTNWPSYNFVWAIGSTHQVGAAATQTDSKGRQYTFTGWSNGAGATQTVTVASMNVTAGLRLTATYSELSRVVVQSSPAGQSLQVDGSPCLTPCNIDRLNGTRIHVTAPTQILISSGMRLDFSSWSDGAAADHVYTITSDYQTLAAVYNTSYQLTTSSNPANGADIVASPTSPDTFYPQNTQVSLTANPRNGFKFRRWGGDLSGTYPAGVLAMSGPHSAIALLDRIPYVAPAGIQNGAGATPTNVVAPGSIIVILGQSLAPDTVVGPVNPLAQTIDNVTVTVGDQLLPLFSVTPEQVTALLPSNLAPGDYTLAVHSQGQPDVNGAFTVARDAPGVFANPANGKSYILAFHEDGSLLTPKSPGVPGETITFFGTGFGPYTSPMVDGFFPLNPPPATKDPVTILVAGQTFAPVSSIATAGYTGLVSVQFTLTSALPSATVAEFQVQIGGTLSNTVLLPLQ